MCVYVEWVGCGKLDLIRSWILDLKFYLAQVG